MTQKLGHARTVPSACPARRGRNWSPEDGAGLGAWRVGGDDPVPVPRTPQAVQCDVSVEEDSHQEWTFTLYGFDNSGKATREVADKEGWAPQAEEAGSFLGSGCGEGATTRQDPGHPAGPAGASSVPPVPSRCLCRPWWSPARPSLPWPAAPHQGTAGPRGAPACCSAAFCDQEGKGPAEGSRRGG